MPLGVSDAADELGVSTRRVRQMLAEGKLSGHQIGTTWVIDTHAVARAGSRRAVPGRPWRPATAWSFLALAQGRNPDISPVGRSRLRKHLQSGIVPSLAKLRSRSEELRFYAHPGVLGAIENTGGFVRSGVSAAEDYAIDIVTAGELEGYLRKSAVDGLVQSFALASTSNRPNLILRAVNDECWPFGSNEDVAPPLVAAIDLLDSDDQRTRRAGTLLLESQ